MVEFEIALGTQGKYISPVLLDLDSQRKRVGGRAGSITAIGCRRSKVKSLKFST
jgi:hypothetical protein